MALLALDDKAIELVETADGDLVQLLQRLPADQRAAIEAYGATVDATLAAAANGDLPPR